jgi:hypothetical protein
MRLTIPEILAQVVLAPTKAEKIATLQKHNNPALRDILRINFDPAVKLDIPAGPTPVKINKSLPIGLSESNLYNESRRLYVVEPGQVRKSRIQLGDNGRVAHGEPPLVRAVPVGDGLDGDAAAHCGIRGLP